ncbi:alpha/beta hydrolase family protein [Aliikangiella maris]|uniref:Prolyl oligopeptidase family serine peptidase n=2 Tax=Aliikangiella maris TaxID=3162458 RepID=A0ABV3MR52_9GAMM
MIVGKAFVGKQIVTVSQQENSDYSIIFVFASNDSGSYYLLNKKTLVAELILKKYESHKNFQFAKSELLSIKVEDDQIIEGILTRPIKHSNKTLLVVPHGGPIGIRDLDNLNRDAQYYTSRGYSVLRVNFRGSFGFGKLFKQSGAMLNCISFK